MAPRLLTLLNLIETALANNGASAVGSPPSRTVNFHKGLARMSFADDSGSILLQNFTLADGQICVRAVFSWEGSPDTASIAIYPREDFDWLSAADKIAQAWMTGQNRLSATITASSVQEENSVNESVAAAG